MYIRQFTSRLLAQIAVWLLVAHAAVAGEQSRYQLVMYEQNGCHYCERWLAEIGPPYPKTAEGQIAPLRMVDIQDTQPTDLSPKTPPVLTPTFVLMDNGHEVARIEGYPGEELFWWMMGTMIRDTVEPQPDAD
jgi:thioredoxin-related protein